MLWSYGITTVPTRVQDGLLERTIKSLALGGFPTPRLFIDGPARPLPAWTKNLLPVFRGENLKAHGNFTLTLYELYIREPLADRYAVFQDDFVTYRNLRQYLEHFPVPAKGYLNLYLFPQNTKPTQGWYPSNQRGLGAVGLVFDKAGVELLLTSAHWFGRPQNAERGWKWIDGGIVESFRKAGGMEYVHNPSLVQHTGIHSTLENKSQPTAPTFRGEDFDALSLLPQTAPAVHGSSKRQRIGLVGYNVRTGLGELNRQIATYGDVDKWLIQTHPKLPMATLPEDVECTICPKGQKVEQFVKSVDVLVFCERPYYDNLIPLAKRYGKRTVCVPMMEWMPPGAKGWPQQVDLFLCPTEQCYSIFAHVIKCANFPWPVDCARYPFKERDTCNSFLFCNGHGGWHGRKGGDVIRAAFQNKADWLVVRSQKDEQWPAGCTILGEAKENHELYATGDVLLVPHSVDGLGLEGMEAMACGMPVISTDGLPWNEIPSIAKIKARTEQRKVQRPVAWYLPDAQHLADLCQQWRDKPIISESRAAREWAESRDWNKLKDKFNELVRYGKAGAK